MVKVGDIFEILLSGNRKAVGHFVFNDKKHGPFIQVFDYIKDLTRFDIEEATQSPYIFPPVITGLRAAINSGLWRVVGNKSIENFVYPRFISSYWNDKTGEIIAWFLFDGESFIKLGPILPEEYKSLEFMVVWSPYDVVYRIETGEIPFPYGAMIKDNRFTPIAHRNDGS